MANKIAKNTKNNRTKKNTSKKVSMNPQTSKWNDLLAPIMFMLVIAPFILRLVEKNINLDQYAWYADISYTTDLYSSVRGVWIIIAAVACVLILAFWFSLYKEKTREIKVYIPIAVYGGFAILSTLLSTNKAVSLWGGSQGWQGLFVVLSYLVIGFYSYEIVQNEMDFKTIKVGIYIMFAVMAVLGFLQVFRIDLLDLPAVEKLLMSQEMYEAYGGTSSDTFSGNNVSLTLYNPNFAGVFLAMFAMIFLSVLLLSKEKKDRILSGVFLGLALVLLWFTYSRGALVAFLLAGILFLVAELKENKKLLGALLAGLVVFFVLMIGIDHFAFNGKYANRFLDKKETTEIDWITTSDEGITFCVDGKEETYNLDDLNENEELTNVLNADISLSEMDYNGYEGIYAEVEGYGLFFVEEDGTYYILNEVDKTDTLVPIKKVDMKGLESLGSGRFYIWSRTIPLLKKYIFVGAGPDRFLEAFPQNDYIGKMTYSHSTAMIIESAHNMYLNMWVETGLVSLIAFLVFVFLSFQQIIKNFKRTEIRNDSDSVILAKGFFYGSLVYLIAGLFNTTTMFTTPYFYIFIGLALAGVCLKREIM